MPTSLAEPDPRPESGVALDFQRFEAGYLLADAWLNLERHASLPTQTLGFIAALARSLLAGVNIAVFLGRGEGGIEALIPLCRAQSYAARWRLAGAREVFEPGDALCAGERGATLLAQVLARDPHALCLDRIPASSLLIPALHEAMRGRGLVSVRPARGCPTIPLDAGWGQGESFLNAGRRSDFRRAERRAAAMGAVFHEIIAPDPGEFDTLFDEAIAVEMNSWKRAAGSAIACDPAKEAFARAWFRHACEEGSLRIAFLRIGHKAVAMQLAVVSLNRYWLFKIGYDEAYRSCSPGNLLMLHSLRHAARAGLEAYELLGEAEPWIADFWTRESHECVRVRTYPFNPRGALALAQDGVEWLRWRLRRPKRKASGM
ncbi:GNAT family N-acetyltransferase [Novosphingobium terrae]|uniref:GNAT family N-acetyltransferase n=1 Tax=Novosphingobium terrae TaxID=2726189 RepID=UPI00197DF6BB|nr:GNAT family N-acetyltransferase [Novosphingobium terrae]